MPRVEFKPENRVATTNYDYPKLKLKSGERARIIVGLEDPVVEYVHTLRKPQIINGVPQKFLAERKDGTTYEDYKMDFVSRPICLGDATILADKGVDPKNCPMCRLAQEHGDYTSPPQRRYAMHVVRYRTKAGTTDVQTPFSVETLVWSFTDKTFNKLVDFKEEWGDLRQHDLLLGPCTNEVFQQFDITVAAKGAWLEDPERKKLTAQTFKENQIPDLTVAVGSAKQKQWIEQDIHLIVDAWGQVLGAEPAGNDITGLDEDLNGLIGKWADETPEEKPTTGTEPSEDNVEDLLSSLSKPEDDSPAVDQVADEKPEEPIVQKGAAKKPSPQVEKEATPAESVDNFDDLLADL